MASRDLPLGTFGPRQRHGHLPSPAAAGVVQHLGDRVQLSRSDDHIDVRRPLEDRFLVLLCHASHDTDHLSRIAFLHLADLAERAVNLLLRIFANATGVVQNAISLLRRPDHRVAVPLQIGNHHLAVQNIHLAADGLDVHTFVHRCLPVYPSAQSSAQSSEGDSLRTGSRPSCERSTNSRSESTSRCRRRFIAPNRMPKAITEASTHRMVDGVRIDSTNIDVGYPADHAFG